MSVSIRFYFAIQRGQCVHNLCLSTRGINTRSMPKDFPATTLFVSSFDHLLHYNFSCNAMWWANRLPQSKRDSTNTHILATSSGSIQSQSLIQYRLLEMCRSIKDCFQRWKQFIIDAFFVSLRTSEIVLRCSPFMIIIPASFLAPTQSISTFIHRTSWRYTLYTIQQLGPAFIKLFQWAATRRDLFPSNICDELSRLHDTAYVHGWDQSHWILQKEFGQEYASKLKIDPMNGILGSGSAAQVYLGKLFDDKTGQEQLVAVKILHPGIRQSMERDLIFMKRVTSLLDALPFQAIKMLSLPHATNNFAVILREQLDLRLEAKNLETFANNFSCTTSHKVAFPKPIDGWVTSHVLVEEYVENANSIYDYLKDDSITGLKIRKKLAGPLLRAFLKMIFIDNFVHADLHSGNILVREIPKPMKYNNNNITADTIHKEDSNHIIYFLDAGLVTQLSPRDRQNLRDLFKAIILNEGAKAGRLMVERARYERCSSMIGGVESFSQGVGDIVNEFHDRRKSGLTLGVIRIGALLAQVLDLCRVYGVEIDPAMANIVLSTLVLEGLGRSLDENLNLIDCAVPFVLGRV